MTGLSSFDGEVAPEARSRSRAMTGAASGFSSSERSSREILPHSSAASGWKPAMISRSPSSTSTARPSPPVEQGSEVEKVDRLRAGDEDLEHGTLASFSRPVDGADRQ